MNIIPLRGLLALVLMATAPLLAACGSDDEATTTATTTADEASGLTEPVVGDLRIEGAWARTSPSMATAGVAYLTIINEGSTDDALLGAAVDPSVAAAAELHETTEMTGSDDNMDGTMTTTAGEAPMMQMSPVDRIDIPAGDMVSLEPGGYHIMLLDLAAPLEVGTTLDVTLTFENAGEVQVSADVRDTQG